MSQNNLEPILDEERFPGDTQEPDTRHFQLVVAAVQGILMAQPNISPDFLAARAIGFADAVKRKLKKRS
jgi:hypothetical protein